MIRGAAHTLAIVAGFVAWGFGLVWLIGCGVSDEDLRNCASVCRSHEGLSHANPGDVVIYCHCRDGESIRLHRWSRVPENPK